MTEYLISRGVSVAPLDRTTIPDFTDIASLKRAFLGCDCVVHALGRAHIFKRGEPAIDLSEFRRINVDMALTAARATADAGVPQFLFISSVAVFGMQSSHMPVSDPAAVRPTTPYGISKAEAEDALEDFGSRNGLAVLTLRPPIIYGPGAPGNFGSLVSAIRKGIPLPFSRVTGNRRTFLARDNLSDAVLRAVQKRRFITGRFIVSDSESVSTRATIEAIAKGLRRPARLLPFSPKVLSAILSGVGARTVAAQLIESLEFDAGGLRQALDWQPAISPHEGLRRMGAAAI